jgi:hypothetical protein
MQRMNVIDHHVHIKIEDFVSWHASLFLGGEDVAVCPADLFAESEASTSLIPTLA